MEKIKNFLITGVPGIGKTTLFKECVLADIDLQKNIMLGDMV